MAVSCEVRRSTEGRQGWSRPTRLLYSTAVRPQSVDRRRQEPAEAPVLPFDSLDASLAVPLGILRVSRIPGAFSHRPSESLRELRAESDHTTRVPRDLIGLAEHVVKGLGRGLSDARRRLLR